MRLGVTGTPGTGKTTATDLVESDLDVVHLNEMVREEGLYTEVDEERDSVVADLEAVATRLEGRDDVILESHLAHHLDLDAVVVLRCEPTELEGRLRDRGASAAKAEENAESEALDVILSEAVDRHGRNSVYEVDTTDRPPAAVAEEIEAVIAGELEPSAGTVDFTDYL
ncbi:adenylate kinase family protein [Halanaeroarchaeum sulfurireducens]|uniref:Putative adenylate kinase n=1 Tax=Halanaeroarchaeum sulfurireducens TaxID=1604004 RepID=A0A0N9NBN6_9EURY|nr:adenylate kinase family protein [Halanaeroarchaeum sulfurireducens]ALG82422.1 putative nucleotide kinase [Halanaeroarchaeum sulfurireducens]